MDLNPPSLPSPPLCNPAWSVDVGASFFANPCVVGSCINDGQGSYSCICPPDFYSGTTIEGNPSCSLADNCETLTGEAISYDDMIVR